MAIVTNIIVAPAGADDHDRLQERVEARIDADGSPPDGLMLHVAHPHEDGFLIVEAWRDEESFRAFVASILAPALRDVHLEAREPRILAAWSIARP